MTKVKINRQRNEYNYEHYFIYEKKKYFKIDEIATISRIILWPTYFTSCGTMIFLEAGGSKSAD